MKEGDDRINLGFVAQDIEALLGENYGILSIGEDKDRMLSLRYTDFIAPLVKAVQEQQARIETLHKVLQEIAKQFDIEVYGEARLAEEKITAEFIMSNVKA